MLSYHSTACILCAYPTHSDWPPPSLHRPYFKSVPLVCGASYLTLCALWVILGNLHRALLHSPVGPWPYASLWGSGTHLQKVFLSNSDRVVLLLLAAWWWSCGALCGCRFRFFVEAATSSYAPLQRSTQLARCCPRAGPAHLTVRSSIYKHRILAFFFYRHQCKDRGRGDHSRGQAGFFKRLLFNSQAPKQIRK